MNLERILAVRTSKTVYRDGNMAIKVFDADYSKADVLNEALNQARVEETGLPVPKILGVSVLEGKWAICSEFIKGKTLARLMQEEPEKYDEYLALFVDLQMQVHSKRAPLLGKLRDKLNRKILDADLDATLRYDLHTRLDQMPRHSKLCHGDFNPSNIILSDNGPYILDWSHATQGNASADVAITYLEFWLSNEFEHAQVYLDLFCKKSGTNAAYISGVDPANIKKWLPIVAAALSIRARPQDRERLLSWASAMDYE